jgi:phosphonate degradation associated HDIG domain protein
MTNEQATAIAEDIIRLYRLHGGEEYAGEAVTQLEHMVQAAQLAEAMGYDEEVILAAFLHDIGHICVSMQGDNEMDGYGVIDHEEIGAAFLRDKGFSERLIRLVESHVNAKRYLTYSSPEYYDSLSEASKRTLEFQGGKMNEEEAAAFEADPLFDLMIRMRRWDEAAKVENLPVPDLLPYQQMIVRHLLAQ